MQSGVLESGWWLVTELPWPCLSAVGGAAGKATLAGSQAEGESRDRRHEHM